MLARQRAVVKQRLNCVSQTAMDRIRLLDLPKPWLYLVRTAHQGEVHSSLGIAEALVLLRHRLDRRQSWKEANRNGASIASDSDALPRAQKVGWTCVDLNTQRNGCQGHTGVGSQPFRFVNDGSGRVGCRRGTLAN